MLILNDSAMSAPLLVCCDLQHEHCQPDTPQRVIDFELTVMVCQSLLSAWRQNRFPVAHLRRISAARWRTGGDRLSDWIPQMRPRPGELIFEHDLPSAYSSLHYVDYMKAMRDKGCLMSGFSLDETVLSTVVEGFHRNHRYYLVTDAIACGASAAGNSHDYQETIFELMRRFAGALKSNEVLRSLSVRT